MPIQALANDEKLRFTNSSGDLIGLVYLIDGDKIEKTISEIDVEIVEPVYGDPYFIVKGKKSSGYTSGSLKFDAPLSTLTALESFIANEALPEIRLRYGGVSCPETILVSGILTAIHYARDLVTGNDPVTGQISYINC